jgi:predicted dehydrogenase/threonine dehydrogenase-like Zn-dependent dehydrogenase
MRQLLQNVSTGEISVDEVPAPAKPDGSLLVATRYSLLSPGTERAVVEVGRSSLLGKARARPDLAKKVVESARTEGIGPTFAKVRGRLGEPNALGYSLAGIVLESCEGAPAAPGEAVSCAGAGHASHAEVVAVPRNLCARVPEAVPLEDAAYGTVASIALHGVRLAQAGLGDVVGVVGLGLVGQLTMQILRAAGCVPVGVDPLRERVELARSLGCFASTDADELEAEVARVTSGRGADAVLVTAASKSAEPLATATSLARERATVCIVGDVQVQSPRAPLFAKELKLVVSRSYGPGRYDATYEEGGVDYPAGYVRWTEGRNLEEALRLMASEQLQPSRLTTHTFDLADGAHAYALLGGQEHSLGILLRYPERADAGTNRVRLDGARRVRSARARARGSVRVGVIGAGAFARGVLLPALARKAEIVAIANATGVSAKAAGQRFGAEIVGTDPQVVLDADDVEAVVIATRHDTHAEYAARALRAGKHVFVEKPMGLNDEEIQEVVSAAADSDGVLMVGFNRRFAPLALELRQALAGQGPLVITYRVSAGRLPASHWTHDLSVGGGRITGEFCHFVDFAGFLAGGTPTSVQARAVGGGSEPREDNVTATLGFPDGSVASLTYSALGDPGMPKERIEVLGEHGAAVLDDFASLTLYRGGRAEETSGKRDKGHRAGIEAFLESCRTGQQPWPIEDMARVMESTFAVRRAINLSSGSDL